MKKLILIIIMLNSIFSFAQLDIAKEIVELGKIYRTSHSLSDANESQLAILKKYKGTQLEKVSEFLIEATKENNNIIEFQYLKRPDSASLKLFHTIVMVNYNLYEETPKNSYEIAKKYLEKQVSVYEQIQQYYGSLFISVINKNRPFDYSNRNWNLNELGFIDDKEKAVFFLVFIDKLGSQISSYLNAMRGPNWDGIESYSKLLPQINEKPYYHYSDFFFNDFQMMIYKKTRFFKEYYLQKYYEVLMGHLLMLNEKSYPGEKIQELLLTSILHEKQYYQYCNHLDILNSFLIKR